MRSAAWVGCKVPAILLMLSAFGAASGCATSERAPGKLYPDWLIATVDPIAPVVGSVIAGVAWRGGHLRAHEAAIARLRGQLRPLDVLLTSSRGRLSGHAGYGLFGHAAVYLGTEDELRSAGLWNDPAIAPYRSRIRDGFDVIESTAQHDTALTRLEWLANVDGIALLRPSYGGPAWRKRSMRALYRFIGTSYDFHFRAESHETLYCTELIQQAMPELWLPTRQSYDRQVILPDDLALAAATGRGRLRFIAYLRADRRHWEEANSRALAVDVRAAHE